ncbi:TPA: hypothetical protein M2P43_004996 [Klebsiella variicola]|uniref:hypothetical protein n=1 Tax=Klebsiella pneumoniae complex TaxID=3390273 RepID=UPI001FA722A0|nr:hypothetical protein [Klebsiella variicola]HCB0898207.1 hypothetical protein [Klebsiella variicola subsp. variicola]MCI4401665.1 hypothetical protein [Klebsiella variicola]HBR1922212.1 hypothetical protein [Klebsiella variicola]HCB4013472.1 hypothetical protein [Klebsiella variicola subsp. variicola]HCD1335489.1 hypothetical protein [Klebsiella variicola subsp. variicola]
MDNLSEELHKPHNGRLRACVAGLFDTERNKRWIDCSHAIAVHHKWSVVTLQHLGSLDSRLINDDAELVKTGYPKNPYHDLGDHITSSYLWVLGVYELVRTLDQFARNADSPLNHVRDVIQTYKQKINRLRIPLAKMEAAKSNTDDSPIAYPGLNQDLGLAWRLNEHDWITRRELSDEALALFESIKSSMSNP